MVGGEGLAAGAGAGTVDDLEGSALFAADSCRRNSTHKSDRFYAVIIEIARVNLLF